MNIQLKQAGRPGLWYDANLVYWQQENNMLYPLDHDHQPIRFAGVKQESVSFLESVSDNHYRSQNLIRDTAPKLKAPTKQPDPEIPVKNSYVSQDQEDKGIGILEENERVRKVVQGGSCSDGGASEPKVLHQDILDLQQKQLQSALQDGG